ncbi:Uncharacterized protein Fot_32420 [Forsythia ovata]|uniref:Uncharacterized protein n=1 Tax=Forsythia ovata TaxID=205694 RepID=A0ABD1T8B0_9LAMI
MEDGSNFRRWGELIPDTLSHRSSFFSHWVPMVHDISRLGTIPILCFPLLLQPLIQVVRMELLNLFGRFLMYLDEGSSLELDSQVLHLYSITTLPRATSIALNAGSKTSCSSDFFFLPLELEET